MSASHAWIARAVCGLSFAFTVAAFSGRAAEPWQVLPPTPGLPLETTPNLAEINGARIWYAERGQKAPGVPVLPLHGGFGNSNYFGNLIPSLVAKGYRVIAMDSRGHGRSARTDAPQTYHQMAEDVAINHPSRLGGVD